MDEVREGNGIDDALRELAKKRDELLGKAPPLSRERQAVLDAFLAEEFPIEVALHQAAMKRDQFLEFNPPAIPASAEATLHGQLLAARPRRAGARGWRASDWRGTALVCFFRRRAAARLMAWAMIAAAIFCVGRWGTSSRSNARTFADIPRADRLNIESRVIFDRLPIGGAELFARQAAMGQFNLSTSEPASLQVSFLTNSGVYFADGNQASLRIRLDLPPKLTLMEDNLARTP